MEASLDEANAVMNKVCGIGFAMFFVGSLFDQMTTEFGHQMAGLTESTAFVAFLINVFGLRYGLIASKLFAFGVLVAVAVSVFVLSRRYGHRKVVSLIAAKTTFTAFTLFAGAYYMLAAQHNVEVIIDSVLSM